MTTTLFTGTWTYTLDRKSRLVLPGDFLPLLGEFPSLTRGPEHVLYLLPETAWDDLQARHGRDVVGFHGVYGVWRRSAHFGEVLPGKPSRRLQIPHPLYEMARLSPGCEVAVVGAGRGVILCEWEHWLSVLPGGYPIRNLWDLFGTEAPRLSDLLDLSLLAMQHRGLRDDESQSPDELRSFPGACPACHGLPGNGRCPLCHGRRGESEVGR